MDRSDEGFTLIRNDEFDGDELDSTKWTYMYGTGEQYGTFDQGTARLVYWNLEGMDAVVPDFVIDESGKEDVAEKLLKFLLLDRKAMRPT